MATVQTEIDSARYDLIDTSDLEYTDAELVDYVNRAVKVLDSMLASLESSWVHSTWDPATLSSGGNSVTCPTGWITPKEVWYGTNEIRKKKAMVIRRKRKWVGTASGRPYFWAPEGANIIFERTADQNYDLVIHGDKRTGTLTATDNMPYNDTFNDAIKKAVVIMCKSRSEQNSSIDGVLHDLFYEAALADDIRRTFSPKSYTLDF